MMTFLSTQIMASERVKRYPVRKAGKVIANLIDREIQNLNSGLNEEEHNKSLFNEIPSNYVMMRNEENNQGWPLSLIRFRVRPYVAFDIFIFEVKIRPILEFRWTRKAPEGWAAFKPAIL